MRGGSEKKRLYVQRQGGVSHELHLQDIRVTHILA